MLCDRCGRYVYASNLRQHHKGVMCAVDAWNLKMAREGYKHVPGAFGKTLRDLGYQTILGPVRYDQGFKGRKAKVYDGHWAPVVLVQVIEGRTRGVMTFNGRVKMPLKVIKQQLRVVIRSLNIPRLAN